MMAQIIIALSKESNSQITVCARVHGYLSISTRTFIRSGYDNSDGTPAYQLYSHDSVGFDGSREALLDLSAKIQAALGVAASVAPVAEEVSQ